MSYTPYNTEAEVRTHTGNILNTDYTDPNIMDKLKSAYSKVQRRLGRAKTAPLTTADLDYDSAKWAELCFATAYCLKAYGPEFLDKIDELVTEAKEELADIAEFGVVEEPAGEDLQERTDFKSWGKNANLDPPNRMKGLAGGVESEINF